MGHREAVEADSEAEREAARIQREKQRRRNASIRRARGDGVAPKALSVWSGLSTQQIRRICREKY